MTCLAPWEEMIYHDREQAEGADGMVQIFGHGVYLLDGCLYGTPEEVLERTGVRTDMETAMGETMAWRILEKHNQGGDGKTLHLKFDSLTSHDITYVGIIQTARASGLESFPVPYVLTNCHNSLCAVGGTINEDDHKFALSACRKYGGIYVPPNYANIHSFNRETMAGCGRMILGSDSHTRYGALGTMGVGEGGGELAKQLLGRTYDMTRPDVVAVYLTGSPRPGVGPHDVALALCGSVYASGVVRNRVMEFVGPGVHALSMEFRNAVDVMTTETTCWSSIWETDEKTRTYLERHGRGGDYQEMRPGRCAYYQDCVALDLSEVESMIAMPMHPSLAVSIHELQDNASSLLKACEERANEQIRGARLDMMSKLHSDGVWAEQGEIAGCAGGTYDNIRAAADILRGKNIALGFSLSVYPGSLPTLSSLIRNGCAQDLIQAGALIRECFCGPCFGAGDCPANGELSLRHTTRNFPSREGSRPMEGQMAAVALMDARSVAATGVNGGRITAATDLDVDWTDSEEDFDLSIYEKRVYHGFGHGDPQASLKFGPNIRDWPEMPELSENLLVRVTSWIPDPVTTTDELIPSGETSSYRSNPLRLAEFTLSRRDPGYVGRCAEVREMEAERQKGHLPGEVGRVCESLARAGFQVRPEDTHIGSAVSARMPGDGSAREQAASCQRVLGGSANFAQAYATKRYRGNCVNWGMIPFEVEALESLALGDWVYIPGVRQWMTDGAGEIQAFRVTPEGRVEKLPLKTSPLTDVEREVLLEGCLINYYRKHRA